MRIAKAQLIILAYLIVQWTFEARAAPVTSQTGAAPRLSQFGHVLPFKLRSQADKSAETAHLITVPCCGVEDTVGQRMGSRTKRYILQGSKWLVMSLTYKIGKYPSKLDAKTVDKEIARAFAVWSKYTDLRFSPKVGDVDIEVRFERGEHGDERPFQGTSDTLLAHAFYPEFGGDVHFNDDRNWTVDSHEGYNLFAIAVHEIGHSLGLGHSEDKSAVMASGHPQYDPNFKLTSDDVEGIEAIYGPKTVIVSLALRNKVEKLSGKLHDRGGGRSRPNNNVQPR